MQEQDRRFDDDYVPTIHKLTHVTDVHPDDERYAPTICTLTNETTERP